MRPKIICHMMSIIDGGLRIERYSPMYGKADIEKMLNIYSLTNESIKADGFLLGRNSAVELLFALNLTNP